MANQRQLGEFFAMTHGGIFHVKAERDKNGFPLVRKIKDFGSDGIFEVGDYLKHGGFVGVSRIGIILFDEDGLARKLEQVRTRKWGDGTAGVIGLFLDKAKAVSATKRKKPLKTCDPRWKDDTMAVLKKIGDNHDVFIISNYDELSIADSYE